MGEAIFGPDDDFLARFADLERQVRELATASPAQRTEIVDDDGNVRLRQGRLTAAGGSGEAWGLEILNQPGDSDWPGGKPFFRATEDGAEFPYVQSPMVPNTTSVSVTSGSFVTAYHSAIGQIMHRRVGCHVPVIVPAGTTGELRLSGENFVGASPAVALTDGFSGYVSVPAWAHGHTLWVGPVFFLLEVRRLTGGGTISVFEPPGGLEFRPR
jgi:hypothetical protein